MVADVDDDDEVYLVLEVEDDELWATVEHIAEQKVEVDDWV